MVDQLFNEISREIEMIKQNTDNSSNPQQLDHIATSIDQLNNLVVSIEEQQNLTSKVEHLRAELNQINTVKQDLSHLQQQLQHRTVHNHSHITTLSDDYTEQFVSAGIGREISIHAIQHLEQEWPLSSRAAKWLAWLKW